MFIILYFGLPFFTHNIDGFARLKYLQIQSDMLLKLIF